MARKNYKAHTNHKPHTNLIYYSINSWLAFKINEKYYNNVHYVWVSPYFNIDHNPPSANPVDIFLDVMKSIIGRDNHSSYIHRNKIGIMNGAEANLKKRVITSKQRDEIIGIVKQAENSNFKPLIYVIPTIKIKGKLIEVDPSEKANPFSAEYKIVNLNRTEFDLIEFKENIWT